jgi:hypothetical protein
MKTIIVSIATLLLFYSGAFAQTTEERIKLLEETLKRQEQMIKEQQKLIEELRMEMKTSKPPEQPVVAQPKETPPPKEQEPSKPSTIEKVKEVLLPKEGEPKSDVLSYQVGGTTLRLMDISFDALIAAGTSTERDDQIEILQGGGHDPRKRGFTVQNVELSFMGAVDPYFTGEAHIVYFIDPPTGDSEVELEEAFLTTQKLPLGLQLEAGYFFTEFGRINPQHPHQWNWQDQPVINTRLFGPDGMRQAGFRLGWLNPLPWFSELHFGMQNANGETMASFLANGEFFEERPIGGRPFVDRDVKSLDDLVYLGRWDNSWDLSDEITMKLGFSGLYGPNATGDDGDTWIYGADLKMKWRPVNHFRGWPFLSLEAEIMKRDYKADSFFEPVSGISLPSDTLKDWGFYAQLLYGFRKNWAAGIRGEYVSGSGNSVSVDFLTGTATPVSRNSDPFRNDRYRISPLLAWHPSEFSRFRLQYNYDHNSDRLPGFEGQNAHSVWLGVEFMFGAHAAHKY